MRVVPRGRESDHLMFFLLTRTQGTDNYTRGQRAITEERRRPGVDKHAPECGHAEVALTPRFARGRRCCVAGWTSVSSTTLEWRSRYVGEGHGAIDLS